jgi:hypothetical protein
VRFFGLASRGGDGPLLKQRAAELPILFDTLAEAEEYRQNHELKSFTVEEVFIDDEELEE